MNKNNYVVIMAGGIGSRFWPFSRTNHPKQFHDVLGIGKTMIQQTFERFSNICPPQNVYVVTNKSYKDLVKEQLPQLSDEQILCEPIGRNTAPCVAYASYKISKKNPEACIVVTPSDHIIIKENVFEETISNALEAASKEDILITLGIKPSRPDTGYGYIQFIDGNSKALKKVKTFTEKPILELAQKFIESGDFVWNAGIFIWNVNSITKAFENLLPEMAEIFEEGLNSYFTGQEEAFIGKAYTLCKNISVDYGIMERSENVYVMLADFGWSDLGTWKSLFDVSQKDSNNNVIDANIITYDTKDCIIKTPKDKLVVIQGLENFIVAEFNKVLLICKKDEEQRLREFVSDAKSKKGGDFI
ncbi:MAG TPA: mannose-1-phosphate guanylyltransferase [Cytophagales bacterium]|nr:mannose-1-phosphate guanylyltransferase [Cytophagales bacterium]